MSTFIYPQTPITTGGGALATEAKQDSQITLLTSLDGKDFSTETTLSALNAKVTAVDTTGKATEAKQDTGNTSLATIAGAVSGTEMQVDVLTSALPTGAATEATLAALNAKVTAVDTTSLATEATLSSVDGKVPAGLTVSATRLLVDGSGVTQPVSAASLPLPTGAATEATLSSIDGKDFATQTTLSALNTKVPANLTVTSTRLLVDGSGVTQPVSAVSLPLPTGAATEATLSTVATNTTRLDVVDFLDSTLVDTSSSNIPGSASLPLQVVAALAANVEEIQIVEDIGEYYGIYTGAAAAEVLVAIAPLGGGTIKVQIASGTRVSLRSLTATAISTGSIAVNFLG